MTRSQFLRLSAIAWVVVLTTIMGCGTSPPSRYYALNSMETAGRVDTPNPGSANVTLAIGPVTIPDYLDRPEIVTRSSRNQLTFAEFERWGGSLAADINRVLAEDLSSHLLSQGVSVLTWRTPAIVRYKIPVSFNRFEASGEMVLLSAQWGIIDQEESVPAIMKESFITRPLIGKTYPDVVAAMSDALAGLSLDIAEVMKGVVEKGKSRPGRLP